MFIIQKCFFHLEVKLCNDLQVFCPCRRKEARTKHRKGSDDTKCPLLAPAPLCSTRNCLLLEKTTPKKTTTSQKELHHHHYSSHLITSHHHATPHGLQVSGALLSKARQEAHNASAVNSVMDTFPFAKVSPDRPLAQSLSFDSFVRSTERVPLASHHRVEAATGLGEDRVNVGLYARSGSSPHRGRSYGLTF